MNKAEIQDHLKQLSSTQNIWIAYSGGLDSHVLLHALSDYPAEIHAIHIHHGLSPKADDWAKHCQNICSALKIPLVIKKIKLPLPAKNIEALAREKRYEIFSKLLKKKETLVTAHHQDDQAETFLLQLFRGAGLKGLSAMPEKKPFSQGTLIRPLLKRSRKEIKTYAEKHQLNWIEDESNQNIYFSRNFIRHELMPNIEKRWPSVKTTLAQTTHHLAEAQDLLSSFSEKILKELMGENQTLSIEKLLQYSQSQQKNIIRHWLIALNFPLPSRKKLHTILKDFLLTRPDAKPLISWGDTEVRRYQGQLYALKKTKKTIDNTKTYIWNLKENPPEVLQKLGCCHKSSLIEQGIKVENLETVSIYFRKAKRHHEKSLKKRFQDWKVPPWEREYTPLIYHENQLIGFWKIRSLQGH
jgi:tRNA(Ile)-lysidine synthase